MGDIYTHPTSSKIGVLPSGRPGTAPAREEDRQSGEPVPTEETLLGAFFDVTNPMKVGGADPLNEPGNR
jgi:hypothetical protein